MLNDFSFLSYKSICTYQSRWDSFIHTPHTHTHTHTLIYIYIFTYLLSPSIHGYQEKRKKNRQEQEIKISRITARGKKEKNIIGQKKKEKANSVTPVEKKSRDIQSVGQKKNKTHRKRCNATITRVLNTSGANYKINLNRKSKFSY